MCQIKSIVDKEFSGERMSFIQLIKKYNIVIPVIQRDYAQGRTTEKPTEIRNGFVSNLISYLHASEGEIHDLDFVYGTVVEGEFIPLDGQQRLTTLFLLHLYVASKAGKYNDFVGLMMLDGRGRVAYKTRQSSTMFCERLLTYQVILPNYDTEKGGPNNTFVTLQEKIKDQGWYFLSWLNDPTVAGMMVMLDEMDSQFSAIKDFDFSQAYERLIGDNAPVTFQMLPLNGYNRTDDLYIKLNARGIHLSDFENFKARLEDWMKDVLDGDLLDEFKKKVDGEWNDYLWQFRNGKDNTDHIMENLFRNFIAFSYRPLPNEGQSYDAFIKQVNETMSFLLEQNGKNMRFSFSRYSELKVMPKDKEKRFGHEKSMMEKVISFFNIYCKAENHSGEWSKFTEFIENGKINKEASYSQRLRLYAYLQYCNMHSSIDPEELNQWMRLIRNLDSATDIDTAGDFYRALISTDDMLKQKQKENKKVQEWLATMSKDDITAVKFFRNRQMKEECIKARLLARECKVGSESESVKNAISKGDENDYFKGQIGFALEFAGAYDYFVNDTIEEIQRDEVEKIGNNLNEYIQKTILVKELLDKENKTSNAEEETRLLERALLSLGMYLRKNSANRYNFCNSLGDPYNSLKTLLFVENDNKYCRDIFKVMLDKIKSDTINKDLLNIINNRDKNSMPEWRNILIENPSLIDYCKYGFIYIEGNATEDVKKVILFGASQMNHYHSELWTRDLYNKNKPIVKYREQKKYEEDSTTYLEFTNNDIPYEFRLFHWDGRWKYQVINVNDNSAQVELNLDELDISQNDSGEIILDKAKTWISKIENIITL